MFKGKLLVIIPFPSFKNSISLVYYLFSKLLLIAYIIVKKVNPKKEKKIGYLKS
jgi:hypothetical protein